MSPQVKQKRAAVSKNNLVVHSVRAVSRRRILEAVAADAAAAGVVNVVAIAVVVAVAADAALAVVSASKAAPTLWRFVRLSIDIVAAVVGGGGVVVVVVAVVVVVLVVGAVVVVFVVAVVVDAAAGTTTRAELVRGRVTHMLPIQDCADTQLLAQFVHLGVRDQCRVVDQLPCRQLPPFTAAGPEHR